MTPNLTALTVFSKATLSAIRLALTATESTKVQEQAEFAAYANARALGRAALVVLRAQ